MTADKKVIGRPDWDEWFMTLCFVISQKSLDPHTKHGCVVVDDDRTILSVGYNSPPRGCDDTLIPLERPAKYKFMEHSESNAVNNAARTGTSLRGSTFYITGHPCQDCLRRIINVGAKKIIYGPVGSQCISDEDMTAMNIILKGQSLVLEEYSAWHHVDDLLQQTRLYIDRKLNNGE